MKKLFLLLIIPTLLFAQKGFRGNGTSVTAINSAIADSNKWTDGTTVNSIKPRDAKTVEADSAHIGTLHVSGNSELDGNLVLATTVSESLTIAAGGIRNEGSLRQKGAAQFSATATPVMITADGKITAHDSLVSKMGIRIGADTVTDQVVPTLVMKGDADSDGGAIISMTYTSAIVGVAAPTSAYVSNTLNQGLGYYYDRSIGVARAVSSSFTIGTSGAIGTIQTTITTPTDGFVSAASTNATAAVPIKISPRLRFASYAWDSTATAAGKIQSFTIEHIPRSGGTVLPAPSASTARLAFSFNHNNDGYSERMSLYGDGKLGLGTTAPTYRLQIAGVGTTAPLLRVGNDKDVTADSFIVVDTKANIGIGTSSPYHDLSIVNGGGITTGLHVVNSTINKNRTTAAQAADSASAMLQVLSTGQPMLRMRALDGDSLSLWDDGSSSYLKTPNFFNLVSKGGSFWFTTNSFYPNTSDNYTIGQSTRKIQDYWGSDNIYLGGKGQTATITWGQQNTMTEQTDSTGILDMNAGSPRIRMMNATGSQGLSYNSGAVATWDSLNVHREKSNFADDDSLSLATGVAGWGSIMAGDAEQYANFVFKADGTVILVSNSAKVSRTYGAGDDSLMVYDGGSGVKIKNRLGAAKKIAINVNYFLP